MGSAGSLATHTAELQINGHEQGKSSGHWLDLRTRSFFQRIARQYRFKSTKRLFKVIRHRTVEVIPQSGIWDTIYVSAIKSIDGGVILQGNKVVYILWSPAQAKPACGNHCDFSVLRDRRSGDITEWPRQLFVEQHNCLLQTCTCASCLCCQLRKMMLILFFLCRLQPSVIFSLVSYHTRAYGNYGSACQRKLKCGSALAKPPV